MKGIISQLIDDFHERELPELLVRDKKFAEIKGKADVVIGMRRSGKTFLCYQKIRELIDSGIIKEELLYINFEDDRLLDFAVNDFASIIDVYFSKYPENRNKVCYFFFDEIQRIDQWELFIRRLLDTENIQLYLTGSSSKLLSTEIASSLRGRSLSTEIFPYSFDEFLKCHGLFEKSPTKFGSKTSSILRKAVADFIDIGGFPEVQMLNRDLRIEVLQGYINLVLLRDVIERHKVSNVIVLKHLVRHIMNSTSGKFSVNRFYNTMKSMSVKCTKNSLYEFLDHLKDAYLFYSVPVHTRSEKARIINPTKIYSIDTGLINAMTFRNSKDHGQLLENIVFMHLRRNNHEVEYVKTEEGLETDFFARDKISGNVKLIQVCWDMADKKTFNRELRGLKSAMDQFSIDSGTIVTWDEEETLNNDIRIIPAWKWLLADLQ